jgi:aromatic ring-opening dioxygenase catalytic subunit (LigB family)
MAKTPTYFIPHGGGPCFFMEWTMGPRDTWDRMGAWLKQLGPSIRPRPPAIVVISAHWEEVEFTVTANAQPPLIYDYYGFPEHTYRLQYPAPGAPALAAQVHGLLSAAGLPAKLDPRRGFDHGVFIPFKLVYPEADIPIVQLSLQSNLDPQAHLRAGAALQSLRDEGILIVGSGMSYHNMQGAARGYGPQAAAFDAWLTDAACQPDGAVRNERLSDWLQAPAARNAHPREEHLLPLMVAAGAAGADPGAKLFTDQVLGMTVSAFGFGLK